MEILEITSGDLRLHVNLTEEHKEYIKGLADDRGISMSALCRKWLVAGERAEAAVIPDFDDPESTSSAIQNPVEQMFRDELPDSEDKAVSPEKIKSRMKDEIDSQMTKLIRLDDIGVTDGGDIYADE